MRWDRTVKRAEINALRRTKRWPSEHRCDVLFGVVCTSGCEKVWMSQWTRKEAENCHWIFRVNGRRSARDEWRGGHTVEREREREKASNCINGNEEKSEYWYMNLTVHLLCIMLLWAVFCRIHRFIIGTKPLWMLNRNINSKNNFRLRRSNTHSANADLELFH